MADSIRHSCQFLKKPEFLQIFKKYYDIEFNNPSSGGRVVLCGRTDVTKQAVAFCNFSKALKKHGPLHCSRNVTSPHDTCS